MVEKVGVEPTSKKNSLDDSTDVVRSVVIGRKKERTKLSGNFPNLIQLFCGRKSRITTYSDMYILGNYQKSRPRISREGNSFALAIKRRRKQVFDWHLIVPP